ncbi:hypothetical protein K456DRAFT_462536 [Colletotrichum gloeosporioides 23]|nr:hypothetical protein K456DRAFT_462536 [Colletotrichum gloeosporioides 23]
MEHHSSPSVGPANPACPASRLRFTGGIRLQSPVSSSLCSPAPVPRSLDHDEDNTLGPIVHTVNRSLAHNTAEKQQEMCPDC